MTGTSPLRTALDLQRLDGDRFLATPGGLGLSRIFGGQVAAQALRAASLTIDGPRSAHSLHCYFIRPGRPAEPVHLQVERTRDGRAFATRRVTASQEGKPILEMIASFAEPEPGEDWQRAGLPDVPPPDELPPLDFTRLFGEGKDAEIRPVSTPRAGPFPVLHPFWVRVTAPVGPDESLHACLLTYLSDIAVVRAAQAPDTPLWRGLRLSLDHSVWFHRQPRADQWLLVCMEPVAHIGTRALARGSMQTADGKLVASIAQEALLRPELSG